MSEKKSITGMVWEEIQREAAATQKLLKADHPVIATGTLIRHWNKAMRLVDANGRIEGRMDGIQRVLEFAKARGGTCLGINCEDLAKMLE